MRLKSIVFALARDCHASVDKKSIRTIDEMSPKARRQAYEIFLDITEKLPTSRPTIHSTNRPLKGTFYGGGWIEFQQNYYRSKQYKEDAECLRGLRRYWRSAEAEVAADIDLTSRPEKKSQASVQQNRSEME